MQIKHELSFEISSPHLTCTFSEGGHLVKLQDELVTLFVAEKVLNITQLAWTGKNKKIIIYQEIA